MSQVPEYIEKWMKIIEEMSNDNTYKLAWGRAIIECSRDKAYQKDMLLIIKYEDIAECMLKYYWNQLFFFNLKQSLYANKEPYICQYTKELIDKYKELKTTTIPCWFEDARIYFDSVNPKLYKDTIKKISNVLPRDVSHRFMNVVKTASNPNGVLEIYRCNQFNKWLEFNYDDLELIRDYDVILSKLLNYKWAQLLEKFNYAPKIASKVNGISEARLSRSASLTKYKEELLKEFSGQAAIDFYTGKELKPDEISVDHVIPWSFMYSDDIWNLVLTSQSYNSSKSNKIPSKEEIEKLKERNKRIQNIVSEKYKNDLELAIKNGLVDKYYYDCRL